MLSLKLFKTGNKDISLARRTFYNQTKILILTLEWNDLDCITLRIFSACLTTFYPQRKVIEFIYLILVVPAVAHIIAVVLICMPHKVSKVIKYFMMKVYMWWERNLKFVIRAPAGNIALIYSLFATHLCIYATPQSHFDTLLFIYNRCTHGYLQRNLGETIYSW